MISINWPTKVIYVPKADLTLIQLIPTEIRELNLNSFRLTLKDLEDDEEGIPFLDTHKHNTEVSLGGLTYARVIEIINGYTVTFEDGQYAVNLVGANSNVGDKVNVNQVSVRSNNSAGMTSSPAIEYASFNGGVTIDILNGVAGTLYNIGTPENPVDNLVDAVLIADYRGFDTLFINESMTFDSGTNIENFNIIGKSRTKTEIIIDPSAVCNGLGVERCNVSGTLDGNTRIRNCTAGDLTYVNGHILDSALYGTIILAGSEDAYLKDCGSFLPDIPPIIDMGGSGQDCIIHDYSGGIKFKNMPGDNQIRVQIDGGNIWLESTIISGSVDISGIGILHDSSGDGCVVNTNGLVNNETISKFVWDEPVANHILPDTMGHEMYHIAYNDMVCIDVVNGVSGTNFPAGTRHYPVDNINDALIITDVHKFRYLHIVGSVTVSDGEDISGYTVISDRNLGNEVIVTNGVTSETYFQDITVRGTMNGSVYYTNCVLGDINNFDGGAKNSLITGDINITGTNSNYLTDCDVYTTDFTFKQIDVGNKLLNLIRCRGPFEITNYTGASAITIDLVSGMIRVASSCVSGMIIISGLVSITDLSGPACVVMDNSLTETGIVNAVLDENIYDHTISGSLGLTVDKIKKETGLIPALV